MSAERASEPLNMHIVRQLVAAREAENWSQREVAKRFGMYHGTYGNYEAGVRDAPLWIVERASRVYGRPICWFVDPDYVGPPGDTVAPELRALLSAVPVERQRALLGVVRELVRAG